MLQHFSGVYIVLQELTVMDGCYNRCGVINGAHPTEDTILKLSKSLQKAGGTRTFGNKQGAVALSYAN